MTDGPDMNTKYSREELLKELAGALDLAGTNPKRWPERSRARLSAFVENDEEAARLYIEAKALDHVLARAPQGMPRPEIEAEIVAAARRLPQDRADSQAEVISLNDRLREASAVRGPRFESGRSYWGGAVLLAASLILGVYIGASGEAIPTLRGIEFLASNDAQAGIAFSGSLFEPSELHEEGQL